LASPLTALLLSRIREHGPLTVAAFMELALYHPAHGYYSRAAQRSGRAGDFFTSVDVGPLFGEMIAEQLDEMWGVLRALGASRFDLVEAGAGNGRLSRDILDAAARRHQDLYEHLRVTLVERSAAARAAQHSTLEPHAHRIAGSLTDLPGSLAGAIVANELLDAFPVHVVTMTQDGLREVVITERDGALAEVDAPLSDPAINEYVARCGVALPAGARAEVGLDAVRWIGTAAAALERGFLLLFDYGHEARELWSRTHAGGTLLAYRAHTAGAVHWLDGPGENDLTSHVNLTAIRAAAEAAGLETLGVLDQTYFLMSLGLADRLETGHDRHAVAGRLAAKTLIMPGGLGSTMKVMVFAKGAGRPALGGLASGRLT
jgi:SAM-dependent MidA family methyltransferase